MRCMHRDPLDQIANGSFKLEREKHFSIPFLGLIGPHVGGIALR